MKNLEFQLKFAQVELLCYFLKKILILIYFIQNKPVNSPFIEHYRTFIDTNYSFSELHLYNIYHIYPKVNNFFIKLHTLIL
jgi:hypothetical protein